MSDRLSLLGGEAVLREPLQPYKSVGDGELKAVSDVVRSGTLSGFMGSPGAAFCGGPKVQEFEAAWRNIYGCRHAVSVNSATSGLMAAMGAIGIGPGDEVIVPPYTMSATAMAPLIYGGIPVFVDIEAESFCLDPVKVEAAITPRTRAILTVNLFGRPGNLIALRRIADQHKIALVEDSAQAPFATEAGRRAGLVGDIGVFSLNYHKHIHAGEGGVCVTNNDRLGHRLALIRNHGENVLSDFGETDPANLIGFNFRMTEMSAAVGIAQIENLESHLLAREKVAAMLNDATTGLDGFKAPTVPSGSRHNYYCWALRIDEKQLRVRRATISAALLAEGMPFREGYMKPLYTLPVFKQRRAIGRDGWPFTLSNRSYYDGMCPVTEQVEDSELLLFLICAWNIDEQRTAALCNILRKVHSNLPQLRAWEVAQSPA